MMRCTGTSYTVVVVATVCGWWWHYVLSRESKARTSSNKKAPLPPGSLGLPLLGETLEFLRLTQAEKSAEFLNPHVAKYGQVWAQNPTPFLVPPPLNPSFLPPIQFRFLSEVSRNPMLAIQFKVSRFEYWDFSVFSTAFLYIQSRSPDLSLKIFFSFSTLSSFFFHIQWKSPDLGFLSSQPIHSFPFNQSL